MLPFGIATALFVCQMLLNQITKHIRNSTKYVWGHIDDVIIAHADKHELSKIVSTLLNKLKKAGWELNMIKSNLIPSKSLTFLGACWADSGVTRNPEISDAIVQTIRAMSIKLKTKKIQKIYGFLNYYLSYSKFFSSFLYRFIKEPSKIRPLLYELVKLDYLPFKVPNNKKTKVAFADATPSQIGGIASNHVSFSTNIKESNIMIAETLAALVTISLHKHGTKINLHTDNTATLSFLNKGTARFLLQLNPFDHYKFCMTRYLIDEVYELKATYIKFEDKPADWFSRL